MKAWFAVAAFAAALSVADAPPALAAAGVGDPAPDFEGKEFLGIDRVSLKDLNGKVVFIEVFRTW